MKISQTVTELGCTRMEITHNEYLKKIKGPLLIIIIWDMPSRPDTLSYSIMKITDTELWHIQDFFDDFQMGITKKGEQSLLCGTLCLFHKIS